MIGYRQHTEIDAEMIEYLDVFLKLRELKLYLELNALPVREYLDYEMRFMKERQSRIERGIPFLVSE